MKGSVPATGPRGGEGAALEPCFAELWEECRDELVGRAAAAFHAGPAWRDGVRAAAWEVCRWLREDEARARVLFLDICFADEPARARRDRLCADCAALLHRIASGRAVVPVAREHADAVVGAIWHRVAGVVRERDLDALPGLVPQLMFMVVLPYLGAEAAREELRRGPADIARHEHGDVERRLKTHMYSEVRYRLTR